MRLFLLATAALIAVPASASTVLFSENFDSITTNQLGITTTVASMLVTGGVDAVVPANGFGISAPSTVIDLDGTPGPGTVSSPTSFTLLPGQTYTLSFVVGGAQRGSRSDSLVGSLLFATPFSGTIGEFGFFGSGSSNFSNLVSFSDSVAVAGTAPYLATGFTLTPTVASSFSFSLGTNSADNIGPLLDSVTLTQSAIPEPASWAMLIAGFGLVGAVSRRRRFVSIV